jgi:AbrB family looped-hinge helix DNA binding protein
VGILKSVANVGVCGNSMIETTAKLDEKGRLRIPRKIREATQLSEGSCVNIKTDGKTIILEASEPIADKYYGAFQVEKWPENLQDYAHTEMQKRWKQRSTT